MNSALADALCKIKYTTIPNNADLNDYKANGWYASYSANNIVSNLPLDHYTSGKGAFTLLVIGISDTSYTNQVLFSTASPSYVYIRHQTSYSSTDTWTAWHRLMSAELSTSSENLTINISNSSREPSIQLNRTINNKSKFSKIYESYSTNGQFVVAQSAGGSDVSYTRLTYDGSNVQFTADGGIMIIGSKDQPVNKLYFSDYGTTLPTAGTKGRVFFKKV